MKKNIYIALFFAVFYFPINYIHSSQNFLRIYPQKRSFHQNEKIVLSVFNRGATEINLKFIPLSEKIYSKIIGNIWSSSYQKKMDAITQFKRSANYQQKIYVNEGANYISIKPDKISGYYLVVAEGNNGTISSTPIMITNLGVITKLSSNQIIVFSVHMQKGLPIPKTRVMISDSKNSKIVYTNANGYVSIPLNKSWNKDQIQIKAYSRLFGHTFTYAKASPYSDAKYYAYIATDKPIYKNTHKVKWFSIIRYYENGSYLPLKNTEINYSILSPDREIIYNGKMKTDSFGKATESFNLPGKSSGIFHIILDVKGEKHQGDFLVKDYVKPKLSVQIKTEKNSYLYTEKIRGIISAKYIYGDIPENANVEYTVYKGFYQPPAFDIKEEELFFDILTPNRPSAGDVVLTGKGSLDTNGEISFLIPETDEKKNMVYTIIATVFARTDESVTERGKGQASVKVFSSNYILQSKKKYSVLSTGQKEYLRARLYDIHQKPIKNKNLSVTIYREIWDEKSGYHHQRAKIEYQKIKKMNVKTNQKGIADIYFSLNQSGRYQVTLSSFDRYGNLVLSNQYYWVISNKNGMSAKSLYSLNIESDKSFYSTGDQSKVLFSSSEKNIHLFYTLEGDDIYNIHYKNLKNHFLQFSLKLNKNEFLPNVFIHAFYVKNGKLTEGTLPIFISPKEKFIQIDLHPDKEEYKPKENVHVDVSTRDAKGKPLSSSVTISVVDESVFLVQPTLAPSIQKFFYGKKPNRVSTSYSFPNFFTGGDSKSGSIGEEDRFKFKDTAYFNNSVITNENGKASFHFTLPDNITSWRISAIGADKKDKVGSSKINIIARKELIVSLMMPRYLNTASSAEIVSIINNRTKKTMRVQSGIEATLIEFEKKPKNKILEIPPHSSKSVVYRIKRPESIQSGKNAVIRTYAISADKKYHDSVRRLIPIYESGVDHVISSKPLWIAKDKSEKSQNEISLSEIIQSEIDKSSDYYMKKIEIIIIPNLVANAMHNLNYLIEYPHGCTEQTTSKLLANLRVKSFLNKYSIKNNSLNKKLDLHIKAGIKRLEQMQNVNRAAWGWWQSRDSYAINHWMSVYAMYGLSIAKKQGYKVNEKQFSASVQTLQNLIYETGAGKQNSFDGHDYPRKESFVAFATYVLSITGNADVSNLDAIMTIKDELKNETLSWAIMALNQMKEKSKAKQIANILEKRKNNNTESNYQIESANTSIVFQKILSYSGLITSHNKKSNDVNLLLDLLENQNYNGKLRSTRETYAQLNTVLNFLESYHEYLRSDLNIEFAYGTWHKNVKANEQTSPIRVEIPIKYFSKEKNLTVKTSGKGLTGIYFTARLFERTEKFKPQERGIRVIRSYSHTDKRSFTGRINQGETLDVTVSVNVKTNQNNYLMVVENIPPGFVLESEYDDSYGRKNVVIEKDRIYFYLENYYHTIPVFRYRLRAVNKGIYLAPPARAEFMYFDEIYGTSASEIIYVD